MIGPTNAGGGSLPFRVEAFAEPLPASAGENTIAVITTQPISGWQVSYDEPAGPKDGYVWLRTIYPSRIAVPFTTLSPSTFRPTTALQLDRGVWTKRKLLVYQTGEWRENWFALYDNGNVNEPVTGGWAGTYNASLSINNDTFTAKATDKMECMMSIANPIDLTAYSRYRVYAADSTDWNHSWIGISDGYLQKPVVRAPIARAGWTEIDISDMQGKKYITLYMSGRVMTVTIRNHDGLPGIYLE